MTTTPCIVLLCLCAYVSGEYYWRDFTGYIPYTAVPGGKGSDGKNIYIGQTVCVDDATMIPTTISRNEKIAFGYVNGRLIKTNQTTKILCSRDKSDLKWAKVDQTKFGLLTDCPQIIGGITNDKMIVIGRGQEEGRHYIGKAMSDTFLMGSLNKETALSSFEVLTYGCNNKNVELSDA